MADLISYDLMIVRFVTAAMPFVIAGVNYMKFLPRMMIMILASVTLLVTPAEAESGVFWQAATGFDYSVGKYGGASDTTVLSIPFAFALQSERLRLQATIPYLDVRGPGILAGGVVVRGNRPVTTRTGLGDLNLGAAWLLKRDSADIPAIQLAGDIKVPTAGNNLGTGQFDYAGKVNLYHALTPRMAIFGSIGYQWLTSFRGIRLESGTLASAGINFKATTGTSVGISASYRAEYYRGLGDLLSLAPYISWNFASNWRLSTYGVLGVTRASPSFGAGFRLIFRN